MHWREIIAGFALALTSVAATATPPAYTASYEAHAYGNTLKARSSVNYEPGIVRMNLEARVVGFLRLLGRFELSREAIIANSPEGLHLLESRFTQIQPGRSREVHTRMDRDRSVADGVIDGEVFTVPVSDDTMDYLSILLEMMQELQTGTAAPRQTVEVIERDRIRQYNLERDGTETLDTKLGVLETVKITRRDEERDIALSAWFARELHHIPVRFDYEADGRVFVLNITDLDWH